MLCSVFRFGIEPLDVYVELADVRVDANTDDVDTEDAVGLEVDACDDSDDKVFDDCNSFDKETGGCDDVGDNVDNCDVGDNEFDNFRNVGDAPSLPSFIPARLFSIIISSITHSISSTLPSFSPM